MNNQISYYNKYMSFGSHHKMNKNLKMKKQNNQLSSSNQMPSSLFKNNTLSSTFQCQICKCIDEKQNKQISDEDINQNKFQNFLQDFPLDFPLSINKFESISQKSEKNLQQNQQMIQQEKNELIYPLLFVQQQIESPSYFLNLEKDIQQMENIPQFFINRNQDLQSLQKYQQVNFQQQLQIQQKSKMKKQLKKKSIKRKLQTNRCGNIECFIKQKLGKGRYEEFKNKVKQFEMYKIKKMKSEKGQMKEKMNIKKSNEYFFFCLCFIKHYNSGLQQQNPIDYFQNADIKHHDNRRKQLDKEQYSFFIQEWKITREIIGTFMSEMIGNEQKAVKMMYIRPKNSDAKSALYHRTKQALDSTLQTIKMFQ